ncbi:7 transmembrane receptor (rhodopsin family) domain-containing protein [Ditylenchus destructor]|nr:7 transmembrane receptor (rhodopsin family) domain-containing protein [Ditylenchus destructor]
MESLIIIYAIADLCLALHITVSNLLVIIVFLRQKHVRTPTNTYIFSLAVADFLVGSLGIPATVFSVLTRQPSHFLSCLSVHLILCVLCTVSTFHMLSIAIDKYLTICCKRCQLFDNTHHSSRQVRANRFIFMSWVAGSAIGSLPLVDAFGFASQRMPYFRGECHFTVVVDYRYLVYVIFFTTIILPFLVIAYCYAAIYSTIRIEERQIKCLLRASERQRRIHKRRKLVRILLILVLTYAFCWYPLYLLNTADFFLPADLFHSGPTATLLTVLLSHLNCSLNPLIYAYGVPGFKRSLKRFLPEWKCKHGNANSLLPPIKCPSLVTRSKRKSTSGEAEDGPGWDNAQNADDALVRSSTTTSSGGFPVRDTSSLQFWVKQI